MFKIYPSVEMTTYIGFTNPIFRLFVISTLGEIWLPMFKISPSVEMTTYIGFTNPIFRLFVISTLGEIWLPICH
jgi:isoprenylcysteine carboxyl methyltransferase (ICMT) family protein YpbQ